MLSVGTQAGVAAGEDDDHRQHNKQEEGKGSVRQKPPGVHVQKVCLPGLFIVHKPTTPLLAVLSGVASGSHWELAASSVG